MSDQTVRITNLPDTSAKERVAFDLMQKVLSEEYESVPAPDRKHILDLYAECLYAASGYRKFEGK